MEMLKKPDSERRPRAEQISRAAFQRLPRYHQILSVYDGFGRKYISSKELSEMLEINETLVRKDMADLEIRGRQNQGYPVVPFRKRIEEFLGLLDRTDAVLIGAGRLGQALSLYPGFENYGLRIIGLFDSDPQKLGTWVGEHQVRSLDALAPIITDGVVKLAILTVPKDAAQSIADMCVRSGVRAIWNFTPSEISVPKGVMVRNEQIIAGFMTLSFFLKNLGREADPPEYQETGPDMPDDHEGATSSILGTA